MSCELDRMFRPRSVAVVGASNNPNSQGHSFLHHLVMAGYRGDIYPVALNSPEVLGLKAYPNVREIPGTVDYVISCVPSSQIMDVIDQCAEKHVAFIHLFTARFAETGDRQAAELERQLLVRVRRAGIRLIGPNCLGIYYPQGGMSFGEGFPRESGKVGGFLQSGGNTAELVNYSRTRGVLFSKVVSYGNALDLNEVDFLEVLSRDDETQIIVAYIEGLKQPKAFFELLKQVTPRKPVVILKGGRSNAGARSTSSHTAALAGSYGVWRVAMQQAGAIETRSMQELIDIIVTLYFLPPIRGNRVGVAGGGGGMAVRTADEWEEGGFTLPPLPEDIMQMVRDKLPSLWWNWVKNPLDVSVLPMEERAAGLNPRILRMMAQSPAFDLIAANVMMGGSNPTRQMMDQTTKEVSNIIDTAASTKKPFVGVIDTGMLGTGELIVERWLDIAELKSRLVAAGVPVYRSATEAAIAVQKVARYYRRRHAMNGLIEHGSPPC